MKTFTSNFSAEVARKRGAQPVWILSITAGGVSYYISDIALSIPGWNSGITTKAWISQWGQIQEQITGSLNEIKITDFSCSLIVDSDDDSNIIHLATEHNLESLTCILYLWYRGLDATIDAPVEFFRGYVRDVAIPDEFTVTLNLEDESTRLTDNYGTVVSQEAYPTCLPDHIGRLLPVVFGSAYRVKPPIVQINGATDYIYAFGCTLNSVSSVQRFNSDGTYTELYPALCTFYTGQAGSVYGTLAGMAAIRTDAQSGYLINPTEIRVNAVSSMVPIPAVAAVTTRPVAAITANIGTITNEPNQRDGNVTTYATWADPVSVPSSCTYQDGSGGWGRTQVLQPSNRFRAIIRICGYVPATTTPIVSAKIKNGSTWSENSEITHTVAQTHIWQFTNILGPWVNCGNVGAITDILLLVQFPVGTTGLKVYDTWLEVEVPSTTLGPVTLASMASAIMGDTVTGTWSSLPSGYSVNGAITESKSVLAWLDYLAFQFRCWFRYSCGSAKLLWRPDTLIPVATIPAVRVDGGRKMWSRKRAAKSEIVNAITLKYSRDFSLSGTEAYRGIISGYDSVSAGDFGKLSRDELFQFDFMVSPVVALSVKNFYLEKLKIRYWIEELTVFLDCLGLEFGDVVTLPDGRVGTVVSVGIQPGSVEQMDQIKLTVIV